MRRGRSQLNQIQSGLETSGMEKENQRKPRCLSQRRRGYSGGSHGEKLWQVVPRGVLSVAISLVSSGLCSFIFLFFFFSSFLFSSSLFHLTRLVCYIELSGTQRFSFCSFVFGYWVLIGSPLI